MIEALTLRVGRQNSTKRQRREAAVLLGEGPLVPAFFNNQIAPIRVDATPLLARERQLFIDKYSYVLGFCLKSPGVDAIGSR
jgi:hypothetical protein